MRKMFVELKFIRAVFLAASLVVSSKSWAEDALRIEEDGTIHVPAFDLPESAFLSEETRAGLKRLREAMRKERWSAACPSFDGADMADMPAIRTCYAEQYYKTSFYRNLTDRYDVKIQPKMIAGIYTEVFTPAEGVHRKNKKRVLINVHGGGFQHGSRYGGRVESLPIASVGGIKVVSIDYRMAPEHKFPAASEDIAAVYRELLKEYKPENIGLYGCSAGGAIAAQAIAYFQAEGMPRPGAVGIFCAGAPKGASKTSFTSLASDSWYISSALRGLDVGGRRGGPNPYFDGVDLKDPLAAPGSDDDVMSLFPPTLLLTGSRDFWLSGAIATHAQLTRLDVEADLHIWEGMTHAFHYYPELPESREAYDVIVKFFDEKLSR